MFRFLTPLFFSVVVLYAPLSAVAATLYFDPNTTSLNKGETVVLTLRLDTTSDECINAVDATIHLDPGLQIEDVSTGNSIFTLWAQQPTFSNDNKTISFAGGIPNGYCGRIEGDPKHTNILMETVIRAPSFSIGDSGAAGERRVRFDESTHGYLNDGRGTQIALNTINSTISVSDSYFDGPDAWLERVREDVESPKQFSITLTQDPSAFKGKYFIVFNTTDKQTGIDHYEVMEEPLSELDLFNWGGVDAPWVEVTSPYVLTDQSLNSTIRVRAIDKAGNEYVSTLVPDPSLRTTDARILALYGALALTGLVLLGVLGFIIWRVIRRYRQYEYIEEIEVEEEYEEDEDTDFDESDHDEQTYENK